MPHASWFGRRGQTRSTSCSGRDRKILLRSLQDGFSRWRKTSLLHEGTGWAGVLERDRILRDCSVREDRFLDVFSDSKGNKVDPATLGIEHEAIDGAFDVTLFEDLGNGRTKLTFIGNEPLESARDSGQLEGWNQIFDKIAVVLAGAGAVEIKVEVSTIVMLQIHRRLATEARFNRASRQ